MKQKLVFISSIATPIQIKFCNVLQEYYDAEFWFHTHMGSHRPLWWKIDLCKNCKILSNVLFREGKYLSLDIIKELNRFDPDIVVLGGFAFPSNYIAYQWAKIHKKRTTVFTEISRDKQSNIRTKGMFSKFIRLLYKDIDLVMTTAKEATEQYRDVFSFGHRVRTAQYPSDIDEHLKHPLREKKKNGYVFLFANRLVEIYDPLLAIDIFDVVQKRHPQSTLRMNASGNLRQVCEAKIQEKGLLKQITFLDNIQSWNNLHQIYRTSDILLLPANFSAGNFTIVESMASGMGIIISNRIIGIGASDIVNNKNGFLCNPNREEFVAAIENYFHDETLLQKHGQINKTISEKYSMAATAAMWYDILSSISFPNNE